MAKIFKGQRLLISLNGGDTWIKAIYEMARVNPSNEQKRYMQVSIKDECGKRTVLIPKSEIGNTILVERAKDK